MTLPCALIILGVPLFAIGKHAKDSSGHRYGGASDGMIHSHIHTDGSVIGAMYSPATSSSSLPFQYILGIVLLSLAFICILLELTSGSFYNQDGSSSSSGKVKSLRRSSTEVLDDEDYEETKLLARHYTRLEILKKLNDTCKEIVRQRYQHKDNGKGENEAEAINGSGSDIRGDGSEASRVTMKQKRNVIVYLNSLALQLRYHQDEMKAKDNGDINDDGVDDGGDLYLTCQEAAYHTLSTFHALKSTSTSDGTVKSAISSTSTTKDRRSRNMNNMDHDRVQSAAMALLALSAKHEKVRERNMHEADVYGLDLPIKVMQFSIHSIQRNDKNKDDDGEEEVNEHHPGDGETAEAIAAELQRKCCLYLGALADSTNSNSATPKNSTISLSTVIAQEDGLEAILSAMGWFRYHSHVINWALWAIFHICYDHIPNQCLFVRLDGIQKVCMVMDNIVNDWTKAKAKAKSSTALKNDALVAMRDEAKEVARHGIAILFDLLRYDEKKGDHYSSDDKILYTARKDFMHVRRIALNAGMHVTVKNAMMAFDDNTEIMMMGQQMLIATGYNGDIPKFEGKLVPR